MTTHAVRRKERLHPVPFIIVAIIVAVPLLMLFGCAGYRGNVTEADALSVRAEGGGTSQSVTHITNGTDSISITQPGQVALSTTEDGRTMLSNGPIFSGSFDLLNLTGRAQDTGDFEVSADLATYGTDGDGRPVVKYEGLRIGSNKSAVIAASAAMFAKYVEAYSKASADQRAVAEKFIETAGSVTDSVLIKAIELLGGA